jgi:hypothetical protein
MSVEPDWVAVVASERCVECGFEAARIQRGELGRSFQAEAGCWATLLSETNVAKLRHRPSTVVWSALENAAHVRDVVSVFTDRILMALNESDPEFGWWDHETAVTAEDYNGQSPLAVAAAIASNVERLEGVLIGLDALSWQRAGTRRVIERFSVEDLARFALHESRHHRHNAAVIVRNSG